MCKPRAPDQVASRSGKRVTCIFGGAENWVAGTGRGSHMPKGAPEGQGVFFERVGSLSRCQQCQAKPGQVLPWAAERPRGTAKVGNVRLGY
eukprot:351884-Chlamydomonas_euryale.AAC.6